MAKDLDSNNVSVFNAPTEGGIVYRAPYGTTLPTAYTKPSELDTAFKSLGDLGEDGFTEETSVDSTDFKNVSGKVVLSVAAGKTRTFEMHLIEVERPALQEFVNGNATVDAEGKLEKVELSNDDAAESSLVIYEVLSSGTLRMIVLDRAKPTSFGSIEHSKGSLMDYDVTVTALDVDGKSGTVYYAKAE